MDHGQRSTSPIGRYDGRSVSELLTEISAEVRGRQASQVREWVAITAWADQNIVTTTEGAATLMDGVIDTGVPIAGDGAPLVSEFNLMELIATLGRTPDGGRAYVGRVIECAWRLHGVYAAVLAGRIPTWKAERIADLTRTLNAEAAAFVDRHLAAVCDPGWAQIERLVREAVIRFDPAKAEADRLAAADHRHFDIHEVDEHGLVHVNGLMDAADGHDLNEAVTRRAILRGRLGDESSMGVRRSIAAGELARQDLALDLLIADEETGEVIAQSPGRKVELNVHITDTALAGATSEVNPVGRWEEGDCPVTTTQIKEWLQAPQTTVIVRPVIDLADCIPVDSYEIPHRLKRRAQLRDHTCRHPGCTTKATRCDIDHTQPHAKGGKTCPCNLVPLCRRHHRAKTFSGWRYTTIQPGHYLWTSPHGRHFLVGPGGTRALDPPRSTEPFDF